MWPTFAFWTAYVASAWVIRVLLPSADDAMLIHLITAFLALGWSVLEVREQEIKAMAIVISVVAIFQAMAAVIHSWPLLTILSVVAVRIIYDQSHQATEIYTDHAKAGFHAIYFTLIGLAALTASVLPVAWYNLALSGLVTLLACSLKYVNEKPQRPIVVIKI